MASIYDIKPKFQNLLRPLVRQIAYLGITANQVTICTCGISLLVGVLLYFFRAEPKIFLLFPFWLFFRMALNAIDGMLAREHHMKTKLGGILNELTDVVSDVALYLPFAWISGHVFLLVVFIVILAILTEFVGVVAVSIGATRRYDGPMGKSDRAFVFSLLAIAISFGVNPDPWIAYVFFLLLFLLLLTISNRVKKALQEAAVNV